MSKITLSTALILLIGGSSLAHADESQRGDRAQRGKRDAGGQRAEGESRRGPAGRGEAGERGMRPGQGRAAMMDPAKLVARMMDEFDNDGDRKLDEQELTKLLASMRERMQGARGGAAVGQANVDSEVGRARVLENNSVRNGVERVAVEVVSKLERRVVIGLLALGNPAKLPTKPNKRSSLVGHAESQTGSKVGSAEMKKLILSVLTAASLAVTASVATASELTAEELQFFESKIRPVLVKECYGCHSEQAGNVRGGLRLDTKELMHIGGSSGPAIVAGEHRR